MKFEDWTAEQISNFMPRQNFVNKYFFKFDKIKPCRFKDRNGVVVALFFRYITRCKEFAYKRNGDEVDWKEKLKMKKI